MCECRVFFSNPGQSQHECRISFRGRKGNEEGSAIAYAIGMGLMPHGPAYFMCAWDVAGSSLEVFQEGFGCIAQVGHIPKFGGVTVYGLVFTVDISIGAKMQVLVKLENAIRHFFGCGMSQLARLCVPDLVDVRVLLEVHIGPEQVVPHRETKIPIPPELCFHSSLHGCRPGLDIDLWSVGRAPSVLLPGFRFMVGRGRGCIVGDIWQSGGILKAEAKGRCKVARLKLIDQRVARADFEGWHPMRR